MTWIGGDSCQNECGWSHWFVRSAAPAAVDVYARSGATWTDTSSTRANPDAYSEVLDADNVVYNQVLRLINHADADPLLTPDVIVVYAGANDAWFASRRPGIFSSEEITPLIDGTFPYGNLLSSPSGIVTLAGCVAQSCMMLRHRFPEAWLLLVTPVEMAKVPVERVTQVGNIISGVGEAMGIDVFRADREVDIRRVRELGSHPANTTDGVHTNPSGARLIANGITGCMATLLAGKQH